MAEPGSMTFWGLGGKRRRRNPWSMKRSEMVQWPGHFFRNVFLDDRYECHFGRITLLKCRCNIFLKESQFIIKGCWNHVHKEEIFQPGAWNSSFSVFSRQSLSNSWILLVAGNLILLLCSSLWISGLRKACWMLNHRKERTSLNHQRREWARKFHIKNEIT